MWVRYSDGTAQVAHLSSMTSGSSDERLKRKTKGWNYPSSLSSLTHLVINAIISVGVGGVPSSSLCGSLLISLHGLDCTFSQYDGWSGLHAQVSLRDRTRWKFHHLLQLQDYFCSILLARSESEACPYQRQRKKSPILNRGLSTSHYKEGHMEGIYWCSHLWKRSTII